MKLPRPTTRRYRILCAFMGQKLSADQLVAGFGMFGLQWRAALHTELKHLAELGYLRGDVLGYSLTSAAAQALREAGEGNVVLVPPRRYNVYEQPPLQKKNMVSREPRRPNCPETRPERRFTASDPIPFNDE